MPTPVAPKRRLALPASQTLTPPSSSRNDHEGGYVYACKRQRLTRTKASKLQQQMGILSAAPMLDPRQDFCTTSEVQEIAAAVDPDSSPSASSESEDAASESEAGFESPPPEPASSLTLLKMCLGTLLTLEMPPASFDPLFEQLTTACKAARQEEEEFEQLRTDYGNTWNALCDSQCIAQDLKRKLQGTIASKNSVIVSKEKLIAAKEKSYAVKAAQKLSQARQLSASYNALKEEVADYAQEINDYRSKLEKSEATLASVRANYRILQNACSM